MPNNKQKKLVVAIASFLAIVFILQSAGVIELGLIQPQEVAYGTGQPIDTQSKNYDVEGKYNILGKEFIWCKNDRDEWLGGELLDSSRYIVSWMPDEQSVAITAQCQADFSGMRQKAEIGTLIFWKIYGYVPNALFSYYYWVVDYYDIYNNKKTIMNGQLDSSSWMNNQMIKLIRGKPRNYFTNRGDLYTGDGDPGFDRNGALADVFWSTWVNDGTYPLTTDTLVMRLIGNRVGKINVKCYWHVAYRSSTDNNYNFWETDKWAQWDWQTDDVLVSEDWAYLPSGRGAVRIESTNAIGSEGSDTADGTGIVYTKYVFEENQEIQISVDTGYSGLSLEPNQETQLPTGGYGDAWEVGIYDQYGQKKWSQRLGDGLKGWTYKYKIPAGSFVKGGQNEWKVVLSNSLFDQAETRYFVVDSLEKVPGRVTLNADKDTFDQWDTVYVEMLADANPDGTGQISYFRFWAKYGSEYSTRYAVFPINLPATGSGTSYRATYNFQVTKGEEDIVMMAQAFDSDGRAGPEGKDTAWVEQEIPEPVVPGPDEHVCWRCYNNYPESQTFPDDVACGEGDAADYPYESRPDCGGGGGDFVLPVDTMVIVAIVAIIILGVAFYIFMNRRSGGGKLMFPRPKPRYRPSPRRRYVRDDRRRDYY